ncbi:MAG: aminotransferase class III-fold pyridoxal phosphate-dependent enzyme, partial [Alphaproteobacteria bacterium]|nr:aminotransferase class III-fold pyridoxal phosphate-dependent enzyme [Alphaproteobacteria bacterium]
MSTASPARTLAARRDAAFGAGAPLFYNAPLHIVRGKGAEVFDADGRRYVDMYNNVPCVGHANASVVEAMTRAQGTLNTHSRYLHEDIVTFAERLVALHPKGQGPTIESVIFSCSGTEANEIALRMARMVTGKQGIVCTNHTYHGNSTAVSKLNRIGDTCEARGDVRAIPFPERLRPLVPGAGEDELCEAYLERLRGAIRSLEEDGQGFAGLIVCSILANEGLPDIPRGFMKKAEEIVRAAGGLLIADEVQAGYCRTGKWWGYEVTGFTPDIVVTGKPMGNGLPLAATAASRKLIEAFRGATRYFNTFASSPLQAAVGLAVLDVIERDKLADNVATVG